MSQPQEGNVQPTAEELYGQLQQKLANELAAPLVIDRLVNHHGMVINTQDEAEHVVKSAFQLFDLYHAGKISLPEEAPPSEQSEIQKSANAVDALYREILTNEHRHHNLVNNPEVLKAAADMAALLTPA